MLYYVVYTIIQDQRTGRSMQLTAGPYTEKEILDKFQELKRHDNVIDAYVKSQRE